MLVASLAELDAFLRRLGREDLWVMLDVGHVPVTEDISAGAAVTRWAGRLGGVQLDDARPGVHEHLFPGEGAIDWTPDPGRHPPLRVLAFHTAPA
jgi:sugar phosphate isomerase/epimerase